MLNKIKKKIQQAEVGEFGFQHEQNGIMVVVVGDKNPDGTVKLVDVSAYVTADLETEVNSPEKQVNDSKDKVVGELYARVYNGEYKRRNVMRNTHQDYYYSGYLDCFDDMNKIKKQ
jgi:hypothetical protein